MIVVRVSDKGNPPHYGPVWGVYLGGQQWGWFAKLGEDWLAVPLDATGGEARGSTRWATRRAARAWLVERVSRDAAAATSEAGGPTP